MVDAIVFFVLLMMSASGFTAASIVSDPLARYLTILFGLIGLCAAIYTTFTTRN